MYDEPFLIKAVPETQRLDSSLQKAKAQLSIKTRRHRPSRSRLRDSLSSMEGEDSLDGKVCVGAVPTSCAPLHASFGRSSPSPDLCLSSSPARRDRGLAPDLCPVTPEMRAEEQGPGMHRHLLSTSSQEQGTGRLSTSSQEALLPAASDDSHDFGSDEPGSPTVLLDKKTRRSFLNLGVTLRRTYGKVRKDRSNRLSAGNRTEARSSRSSGPPFVPFSWFSDRLRSSSSPKTSKILSEVTPLPPTPSSLLNVKRANCF
uniref:Sterile alpha motif domain containing 14 n=1 Tax=Electrophorus electricus TaxID=8005 RepID=A0AAY5F219_ELEEL